jgi:hypothetical protein
MHKLQVQVSERFSNYDLRHVWDGYTIADMTRDLYNMDVVEPLNLNFQLTGHISTHCDTALTLLEVALIHSNFGIAISALREILANSAGVTCIQLTLHASRVMRQLVGPELKGDLPSQEFYDKTVLADIVINHFLQDNLQACTAPACAIYNVPAHILTATGPSKHDRPPMDYVYILHLLISQACKQYLYWHSKDTPPTVYHATIMLIKPDGDRLAAAWRSRYGQPLLMPQKARNAFARLYTAQISHDWLENIIMNTPREWRGWEGLRLCPGFSAQSSQLIVLGRRPAIETWDRDAEEKWLPNLQRDLVPDETVSVGPTFRKPWLPPAYEDEAMDLVLNVMLRPCEEYLRQVYRARDRLEKARRKEEDAVAEVSFDDEKAKGRETDSEGTISSDFTSSVEEFWKGISSTSLFDEFFSTDLYGSDSESPPDTEISLEKRPARSLYIKG